jgi:glycosidase
MDATTAFPLRARLEAEFARGGDLAGDDRHARALAHAAILTMPGLPVIYYGDEVGIGQRLSLPDGADFADRWFREPMPWDDADGDRELCERVAALARLRKTTPALHRRLSRGPRRRRGVAVSNGATRATRDSGSAGSDDGSIQVAGRMSPFFDSP